MEQGMLWNCIGLTMLVLFCIALGHGILSIPHKDA